MTGQQLAPLPPLPSVSVGVKAPGAPPLASYLSLPPCNMAERLPDTPSQKVGSRCGMAAGSLLTLNRQFRHSNGFSFPSNGYRERGQVSGARPLPPPPLLPPSPPPPRSPATWLNGNPTSQDLRSHFHGSVSIDKRTLLALTRRGSDC